MSNKRQFMEDLLFLDSKLEYRELTIEAMMDLLKKVNFNNTNTNGSGLTIRKNGEQNIYLIIQNDTFPNIHINIPYNILKSILIEIFIEFMDSFYESFSKTEDFFKAIEDVKLKIKLQETLKEKEELQKVNKI